VAKGKKKNAKLAALAADNAAMKARLIEEYQLKIREADEAMLGQAQDILRLEKENAEYRAATAAASRNPGEFLDSREERERAVGDELFARQLAEESAVHQVERKAMDEAAEAKIGSTAQQTRMRAAAAKYRERTGQAFTQRVVNGRVQTVPISHTTFDDNASMAAAFREQGFDNRGRRIS